MVKCPYCGNEVPVEEYVRHYETCPERQMLPVREVETGRISFIKPTHVREATFEELHMATVWDAMNIAYNTWVESPPRVLHEENVDKFVSFSHALFNSQKVHGVDVEKFRDEFREHLNYYLRLSQNLKPK